MTEMVLVTWVLAVLGDEQLGQAGKLFEQEMLKADAINNPATAI